MNSLDPYNNTNGQRVATTNMAWSANTNGYM